MKILIRNAKVIDNDNGINLELLDIIISDGKIAKIGKNLHDDEAKIINAKKFILTPGLIDMHVHLREPGYEYKETIETGTKAAARGGFTSVAAMANTKPVADSIDVIAFIKKQSEIRGLVNVYPIASITKSMEGKELVDIKALLDMGVVALSEDGKTVKNGEILKRALEICKSKGIPIISHCEDTCKGHQGWVMNQGEISRRLGLKGLPNSAEEVMVKRDIDLARITGSNLHIAHVSTAGSVELIRQAKSQNLNVTAETTPHHFTLTEDAVEDYEANAKMSPPLRSEQDVKAVKAGLVDGTIDVIATDHAPHSKEEKSVGIQDAPCGIVGLETCLPLVITKLVNNGYLTLSQALAKMTVFPAGILNLKKGSLSPGVDADITLIDLESEKTVNTDLFESKSQNTPFAGWKLKGWPVMTIVGGKIVYSEEVIQTK
ncbi:amidohydrolase family protein [Candidatus Poribacteria bacterium]|nr:amidohydrolase family protein [Candidatus Poribacteria bacterium]